MNFSELLSKRNLGRVGLWLICALLLTPLFPNSVEAAPAPPYAVVSVPVLNVRGAPSTVAPVVGQLSQDERVTVLGRNGEGSWLRIQAVDGTDGWIYAEMARTSVPVAVLSVQSGASGVTATAASAPVTLNQAAEAAPIAISNPVAPLPQPRQPAGQPAPNPDPQPVVPLASQNGDVRAQSVGAGHALEPLCEPNRLRTVSLGGLPQAVTALEDRLYVAISDVNSLIVVDGTTDMMLGTSRTSAAAISSVAASTDALYISDSAGDELVITSRHGAVRGSVSLPASPGQVAVADGRAFVLHPKIGAISIVDLATEEVISTLSIGADPRQIVVIGGRAYVGHAAGFLSVVDGYGRRHEQLHLPVNDVVAMTADADAGMIYVAAGADQTVLSVDIATWTLASTWQIEIEPSSIVYNHVTDHLFVLDRTSQFLAVLSGTQPNRQSYVRVHRQPAADQGGGLALLQSKLYIVHPASDYLAVWLDRTCAGEGQQGLAMERASHSRTDLAPRRIEARLGILWPHGGATPDQASYANLTATLLREDGASPACGWEPAVTLWAASGAEPAQLVAEGERRLMTENGVTFPVYDFNDIDVRSSRDRQVPVHISGRVDGVETAQNIWTHSSTGQFVPTMRPELSGIVNRYSGPLDARIWVEEGAGGPEVYAMLLQSDTMLGLAPSSGGPVPQLRWALDNGVTEPELIVGRSETRQDDGFVFTVWRFPGLDPDEFLDSAAQARFWVELPGSEVSSSVLAWGRDIRTLGARLPIPVTGCG